MLPRKTFLGSALVAALLAFVRRDPAAAATASASPSPAPTSTPAPSPLARALAASLQRDLPKAEISDALAEKIAGDIESNFDIDKTFRTRSNKNLPPPDFVFSATGAERP